MDLGADSILISDDLGVAKPDQGFFAAVADAAGVDPAQIAYVGDRIDNDVVPANAAGMVSVLVRRGPWGFLHASWPEAATADVIADSLLVLPDLLDALLDARKP
jgi:FMN phosphatase YigB (HAD superfamily)